MAPFLRLRGAREVSLFSALPGEVVGTSGHAVVAGDDAFVLYRGWLDREGADFLLSEIGRRTVWTQERRRMYDRIVDVPREQAWVGADAGDELWGELADIRDRLEVLAQHRFGFVLLNRYRDGADSVAWHNDRPGAGNLETMVVASLTLGATRAFDIRSKASRGRVVSVDLDHGDLILMRGGAQARFEHRVPKDRRCAGERINLTFRQKSESDGPIEQEFEQSSPTS